MRVPFSRTVIVVGLFLSIVSVAQAASVDSYTQSLQDRYKAGDTIKILVVPGHDNVSWGAMFKGTKEADLTLALAKKLYLELAKDKKLDVALARNDAGYIPDLQNYFATQLDAIKQFVSSHMAQTKSQVAAGSIGGQDEVVHGIAAPQVAYQLYGISKWATEHKYDLIIHVHFNDYGSRNTARAGDYTGYTVYVPESGLPNSTPGIQLGNYIARRLDQVIYPTDMPGEQKKSNERGVVEDFDLIAIGSNETLSIPSALVEYSYIYEPLIVNKSLFSVTSSVLARTTASAVGDYLGNYHAQSNFDYTWWNNLNTSKIPNKDVLALQFALHELGFYPTGAATQVDCPITGAFGKCTRDAVTAFQKANTIVPTGSVGPATRAALNKLFTE